MTVRQLIRLLRRGKAPVPITGWEDAFADARRRALNVDAYTFQIAWAYAREYFQGRNDGQDA